MGHYGMSERQHEQQQTWLEKEAGGRMETTACNTNFSAESNPMGDYVITEMRDVSAGFYCRE